MSGYTKTTWVEAQTKLGPTNMNRIETAIEQLKLLMFNITDYGAAPGNSSAANKTAIDAALTAASSAAGIVFCPPGSYATDGGHVVPENVEVWGAGMSSTIFVNRGSSYTFFLGGTVNPLKSGALRYLSVVGSTGVLGAVANAIGVRVGNGQFAELESVSISDFTATGSKGLQLYQAATATGVSYVERTIVHSCSLSNCTTCIEFVCDAAASGSSFGYTWMRDIIISVLASQTGISVGGAGGAVVGQLYNSLIEGEMYMAGANAIGIDITAGGRVPSGTRIELFGEVDNGLSTTGQYRIKQANDFYAHGNFWFANHLPPDSLDGTHAFQFAEKPLTGGELTSGDRQITAASTISGPGASDYWVVVGATTINHIAAGAGWPGRVLTLMFSTGTTVTNVAGGANEFVLNGTANFVATSNSTLTVTFIDVAGGVWYETGRMTY